MLNPEHVKAFWAFMQAKYGTRVVTKAQAPEMQFIAEALGAMHIVDKDEFLSRFTTTIGTTIYTSFEVGVVTEAHSCISQIVVCAHEHQHVVQLRKNGVVFLTSYLLDSTSRAAYEAEAYRVTLTLLYYLTGNIGDPGAYADVLKAYATTEADQAFVKEYLRLSVPTLRAKGVPDEASQVTLDWLRQHAPEALIIR